jgi:hypothetical protein
VARKLEVHLLDDMDGSQAEETVKFGLDGTHYEIDLNDKHAEQLRAGLAKYILHGRRMGRAAPGTTAAPRRATNAGPARNDRAQNQAIRDWARSKGLGISERGRIPQHLVDRYEVEAGKS